MKKAHAGKSEKRRIEKREPKNIRKKRTPKNGKIHLRTFAPVVSAHSYCARNSLRDVMPRHALSARAYEEMWRYIALVGT